jgi:Amt family ammonium transporter
MGGFWGAIATGIFASAAVGGVDGLIYGNTHQFLIQLLDASVAMIYAFVMTYILAVIIDKTMGLRVTEEEEYVGLDISQHGESTTA